MTASTVTIRPVVPALSSLYERLSPFAEPLIRVAAGLLLVPHGAQKLFGWFGGYGIEGTGQFMASLGFEPGALFAVLVCAAEFFGGLMLAAGLLTRPAAALVAAVMGVAVIQVHWGAGFFWTEGGFEYPLLWGLIAVALVLRGGGRYSADAWIGREL